MVGGGGQEEREPRGFEYRFNHMCTYEATPRHLEDGVHPGASVLKQDRISAVQ